MTDTQIAAIGKLNEAYGMMSGAVGILAHAQGRLDQLSPAQARADDLWQEGMSSLMASLRDRPGTRNPMEAGYFPSRAHCQCGDES